MTAPRRSRPDLADLLAELDQVTGPTTPERAAARALDRPGPKSTGRPSKPATKAARRSTADRRSGRDFGPSPRQYNRHR